MMLPSTILPQAAAYIRRRLDELAAQEGIRILFAIESGSRAWGFPSTDSDYDVRFVYARPAHHYLSVRDHRDVIETPTLDDPVLEVPLDLNGWDIRKALQLGLKSNPVLHEWLVSPIRYGTAEVATYDILAFAQEAASREIYSYHYDRLARSAWAQIEGAGDRVQVKRYCYALRPALMRLWLDNRNDLPPMDVFSLCQGLALKSDVIAAMAQLFVLKRESGEQDFLPRQSLLDALIASALAVRPERPGSYELKDEEAIAKADSIFHTCLQSLSEIDKA